MICYPAILSANVSGSYRGSRLMNQVMSDSISILAGYRDRTVYQFCQLVSTFKSEISTNLCDRVVHRAKGPDLFRLALEAGPILGLHDGRHGASSEVTFDAVFAEYVGTADMRLNWIIK